jgi:hypothetical protein
MVFGIVKLEGHVLCFPQFSSVAMCIFSFN